MGKATVCARYAADPRSIEGKNPLALFATDSPDARKEQGNHEADHHGCNDERR